LSARVAGAGELEVQGRSFRCALGSEALDAVQQGTMRTLYRGVPCFKSPFDLALYLQLLSQLAPRTVIEIGTKHGGSALWFADMLSAQGLADARVVSVDIAPAAQFSDPRVRFLTGKAQALGDCLPQSLLASCPRPWLVVEDSSHMYADSFAVLDFFHEKLQPGDYIVVEDGIVAQLSGAHYEQYQDGPNRAVADFLRLHPGAYAIDESLCDRYGYNATYNPNGWLRRL
jgi:cephalosporin hydroxylase